MGRHRNRDRKVEFAPRVTAVDNDPSGAFVTVTIKTASGRSATYRVRKEAAFHDVLVALDRQASQESEDESREAILA